MYFKKTPVKVFRTVDPPLGSFTDPILTYIRTTEATVQPFTGDGDYIRNNQMFENVRDMLTFVNPEEDIQQGDILLYYNEVSKVEYRQAFRTLLPHKEVYTSETQMSVGDLPPHP
jgi:hypothetical protein